MAGAPTGNTNASRGFRWRRAIEKALDNKSKALGQKALVAIAEQLLDKAIEGDISALRELGDRIDGKVAQQLNIGGQEDNPVKQQWTIEVVDAKLTDPEKT